MGTFPPAPPDPRRPTYEVDVDSPAGREQEQRRPLFPSLFLLCYLAFAKII